MYIYIYHICTWSIRGEYSGWITITTLRRNTGTVDVADLLAGQRVKANWPRRSAQVVVSQNQREYPWVRFLKNHSHMLLKISLGKPYGNVVLMGFYGDFMGLYGMYPLVIWYSCLLNMAIESLWVFPWKSVDLSSSLFNRSTEDDMYTVYGGFLK